MSERYSTPIASPTYPKAPYHYKDAKLFLALFYTPEEVVSQILPKPLRPSQMPLVGLMFGEMPCVEAGTFMEAGLLAQCMYDDPETGEENVGVFFSHNFVDTDVAMAAGREIWGYPRKIADIKMDWKEDTLVATATRHGTTLLKATCTFTDEGEWIDSGPNINAQLIPSITGEGHDIARLNAAQLTYDIKNGRSGDVEVEFASGKDDDLSMLKIESTMIGLYFDCDILVPYGKTIAELKL
ncbi:MAG: acetoacetate decarboxylase family protein [Candidatus Thorarchaeota archaeon]